ncbi:MAG: tetratricopeptide repeat protein [Rhodocyclaceae bacterium]|nr:tetratricopeptide repeat protein [Rhodocyclaceae bacterium]
MAAYDLEEQEQIEELKTWWKQHGNRVTAILCVVVLSLSGWQVWTWWQRTQNVQAAQVFSQLQQAAGQGDAKRSRELAGTLIEKFSGTRYAEMGAMISAKVLVDGSDTKNARAQFEWVSNNAYDKAFRDLARLRLASVLMDEGQFDEALVTLSQEPQAEFKPRFLELTGDIQASRGNMEGAKLVYEQATTLVSKSEASVDTESKRRAANYRDVILAKTDGLAASSVPTGGVETK